MSTHVLAAVMDRLKQLTGAQTDAELSRALSISPQTLSSWKVRNSIPYSLCIKMATHYACSLDWLLLGRDQAGFSPQDDGAWESDLLGRLRSLSPTDRQAILLVIKDKQRIQLLEQRLTELGMHPGSSGIP